MSQDGEAIRFEGVTKAFGRTVAVDDLNLSIRRGEFFSLLGPSGCGKTTTLRMVAGFEQPTEGSVFLEGDPVDDVPPYRRNVNTVFQSYALFEHLDVEGNVAFGLKRRKVDAGEIKSRVAEALELVQLTGREHAKPRQLSGGQMQRVALARALVNRPAVLLLDEPLGALDLKLRKQMQVEFARIHRQVGTTFVFVTHDQEEALSMATRIAVMSGGQVRQVGPPREIYQRPVDRFVADFIGESNFLDGQLTNNGTGPGFRLRDGTVVPVSTDAPAADNRVALMVRPESVGVGRDAPPGAMRGAVIDGRATNVAFMGNHTRITVETPAGTFVALRFHKESDEQAGEEELLDREVRVWWDPRESTVVTAGDKLGAEEDPGGGADI
jgi:spermidine/putrescine transport system ATP-binding protein